MSYTEGTAQSPELSSSLLSSPLLSSPLISSLLAPKPVGTWELLTRDPEIVQKSLLVQVGREFADIAFHTDMASSHLFRNPYFQVLRKKVC
jgi:hypothetical protein